MRPLIFISNDDGVEAPGIRFLAESVSHLGDVIVVAPAKGQSGMSSALTVNSPLRVTDCGGSDAMHFYSVDGTPVDCVKLAIHHILPRRPDVMLAGINHGSNAGANLIYSGTMGAVMEACCEGIPAIGYSYLSHSMSADFTECRPFIQKITEAVLKNGLERDLCLNINFPAKVKIEGMKVTRSARSHWTEEYALYTDPHGRPFYWLTGQMVNEEPESTDTDLHWLDLHYATIVPVRPDQTYLPAIAPIERLLGI